LINRHFFKASVLHGIQNVASIGLKNADANLSEAIDKLIDRHGFEIDLLHGFKTLNFLRA
jgi:hypothetical protein